MFTDSVTFIFVFTYNKYSIIQCTHMKRAQGILKRWKEQKELDKAKGYNESRIASLTYIIELEYKKYVDVCYWCYETPLSNAKWLSQEIN